MKKITFIAILAALALTQNLLIADEQKNVKRLSKYSGFETDRKFEFLSNLAYVLTISSSNVIFSKYDLEIPSWTPAL